MRTPAFIVVTCYQIHISAYRNFNLSAVGKQIFFSSIWQSRYKMWLFPLRIKTSPQKATSLCGITSWLIRARIFARAEGVNPALPGHGGSLESCTTPSIMSSNSDTSFMCILCGKTIAIHQRPNSRWGWFNLHRLIYRRQRFQTNTGMQACTVYISVSRI